ncbi:MAG: hypothetical protein R3E09_00980 [Novosphingobium sp.]|nr:hypothetical protein [Novosphingobium sp.]
MEPSNSPPRIETPISSYGTVFDPENSDQKHRAKIRIDAKGAATIFGVVSVTLLGAAIGLSTINYSGFEASAPRKKATVQPDPIVPQPTIGISSLRSKELETILAESQSFKARIVTNSEVREAHPSPAQISSAPRNEDGHTGLETRHAPAPNEARITQVADRPIAGPGFAEAGIGPLPSSGEIGKSTGEALAPVHQAVSAQQLKLSTASEISRATGELTHDESIGELIAGDSGPLVEQDEPSLIAEHENSARPLADLQLGPDKIIGEQAHTPLADASSGTDAAEPKPAKASLSEARSTGTDLAENGLADTLHPAQTRPIPPAAAAASQTVESERQLEASTDSRPIDPAVPAEQETRIRISANLERLRKRSARQASTTELVQNPEIELNRPNKAGKVSKIVAASANDRDLGSLSVEISDGDLVSIRLGELISLFEGEMERSLFVWMKNSSQASKYVTPATLRAAGIEVNYDEHSQQLVLSARE